MKSIPVFEIMAQISKDANLPLTHVEKLVSDKQLELSNYVTDEGAAHIIANEVGVKIYDTQHDVDLREKKNKLKRERKQKELSFQQREREVKALEDIAKTLKMIFINNNINVQFHGNGEEYS